MHTLPELQQQFTGFVFGQSEVDGLLAAIKPNSLSAEQRLSIYRNNTRLGLTDALQATFPVVLKLVGEAFFNTMAEAYLQSCPPVSGCLQEYGHNFAKFIERFTPAQPLPYLADTARLEWFCHEAYHEADQGKMMPSKIAALPPAQQSKLRLACHPSLRLLNSSFPVFRIWLFNQESSDNSEIIDLDQCGCKILVFRPELDVEVLSITDSDFMWLSLLHAGTPLVAAVEAVYRLDPYFDVTAHLMYWLEAGLITDFHLQND